MRINDIRRLSGGKSYWAKLLATGPTFFFDAARSVSLSGANVTSATDLAGGLVLSPNGTAYPAYVAEDAGFGGQPSVEFSTGKWLANATAQSTDAEFTSIVLASYAVAPASYSPLFMLRSCLEYGYINAGGGQWGIIATSLAQSDRTLTASAHSLTVLAAAANSVIFRTSGHATAAVTTGSSFTASVARIGTDSAARSLAGRIAACIYWDRALSAGDLATVSAAISSRWGLTI